MTFTLHDYQLVARDFLRKHDRGGLMLDMGLGKTAASLAAFEPRHLPALVVAPKRVAESVWPVEQRLWRPTLSLALAAGDPGQRKAALASGADIVVIGRDNLKDVPLRHSFSTIVLDELSGFKTRDSLRWKTARKLTKGIPHVWGLTGTPAPNGLMDLWAQVYLLDEGARFGNLTTFRSRYFTPGLRIANGTIVEWIPKPEAEAAIFAKLEDLFLAMKTDGRIKLPEVTYNQLHVDLPEPVRKVYRIFKDDLVVDLKDIFDGKVHSASNAAVLTSKLSQITAGFIYEDAEFSEVSPNEYELANAGAYTELHSEKIKVVQEVVEGTGSPVLVFYRFEAERRMLAAALPQSRTIDEPNVIQDWNAGKVPVLIAHPAAAGHGLNLQYGGHTIVWASPTWSLEEWEQGNKRLARQGQQHPVVIHSVMARSTVDHLIHARLDAKANVQDNLLAHLESPI